jgi:hypothetical protein
MKKHVVKALKWAINKFDEKPAGTLVPPVEEPKVEEKKKPHVAKATTRSVAKKATTVAKKATKKVK